MLILASLPDEQFLARVPFPFDLDPKLIEMDRRLDDSKLVWPVSNDRIHSAPHAAWKGRPSTPVEVTLRIRVARRWRGGSYETTHDEMGGDVKWRWFCRMYNHSVPGHRAIQDREQRIQPATLHRLNERVVQLARDCGVTAGRKFRGDRTGMETHLHDPTDRRLLRDRARVRGRCSNEARQLLQPHTAFEKKYFRNRSRRAQRWVREMAHRLRGKPGQKNPNHWANISIADWSSSLKRFWRKSNGWRYAGDHAAAKAPWRSPRSWHRRCPWCAACFSRPRGGSSSRSLFLRQKRSSVCLSRAPR